MSAQTAKRTGELLPRQRVASMLETGTADRIPFAFCYFEPHPLFAKAPRKFEEEELCERFSEDGSYEWTLWDDAEIKARSRRKAMGDVIEEVDWHRVFLTRGGVFAWGRKAIVKTGNRWAVVNITDIHDTYEETAWERAPDGAVKSISVSTKGRRRYEGGVEKNVRNPGNSEELLKVLHHRTAQQIIDAGDVALVQHTAEAMRDRYMVATWIPVPFWRNHRYKTWGYENIMLLLYDNPDLIKQATEIHFYNAVEELKAVKQAGAEVVAIDEYFTSDDEMGVAHFLEFSLPHTRRLIEEAKKLGLYVVFEYGGDPMTRIEHFKDLPADAFWVEEASNQGYIDIGEVRKRLGPDKVLMGNVCNREFMYKGTPEDVEKEVKRQIDVAGKDGYFMMSTGSASAKSPIKENAVALLRTTREYGSL